MEASVAEPASAQALSNFMQEWATKQYVDKYAWKDAEGNPTEVWPDTAYRVVRNVLGALGYTDKDSEFKKLLNLIVQRKFMPGGRYLANSGKRLHQVNNCFLYRCEDSREGWLEELIPHAGMSLSLGGGVGVVYSDVRAKGTPIKRTGYVATGPASPAKMLNEVAREVMSGSRRSAIWGGLHWNHPDVFDWIHLKDWSDEVKAQKAKDYSFPAPMDMTNISVILDNEFFFAYENVAHPKHDLAREVYHKAITLMLESGEPGFSIDIGENQGENLRNACTELTSYDDSDVCNLGSINMARMESVEEFKEVIDIATLFLLAGTVYSDVPHEEVKKTREKNRRLGLGLMGVHEWLLKRGYSYEMNDELRSWCAEYEKSTDYAAKWADLHGLSRPVKTRAIAPNGTIGIVAETTTGIEPIFCIAEKRRFLNEDQEWNYQYVISPTAARLIEEEGIHPDKIEDAYTLSYNYEKRIAFQADIQDFVDHGISSTINLPYPITDPEEVRDFADVLYKYLPRLRGITVYPDGARAGQPLTAVSYNEAKDKTGVTYEENEEVCKGGECGV